MVRLQEQAEQQEKGQEEVELLPEQFRRWQERKGCCLGLARMEEELEEQMRRLEEKLWEMRRKGEERKRAGREELAGEQERQGREQQVADQLLAEQRQVGRSVADP